MLLLSDQDTDDLLGDDDLGADNELRHRQDDTRQFAPSSIDLDQPGVEQRTLHAVRVWDDKLNRLLLVTDGFLERNADLNFAKILEGTVDRHPRQVVRELAENVLQVTGGNLQDDATVLCIDWYGPEGERNAVGGASRARATDS